MGALKDDTPPDGNPTGIRATLKDDDESAHELRAEIARLRGELAVQANLLRGATDALLDEAAKLVEVLSQLEQREARTNAELGDALRFQRAILPAMPVIAGVQLESLYLPAEIVSGDLYDVTQLGRDRVRILIADATGHGVAAALATMFIKSAYETHKRTTSTPGETLEALNASLMSTHGYIGVRFTALCADLDPATGAVSYASAAHPPPIVIGADRTEYAGTGGGFVGVSSELGTFEASIELARGEGIYFVTDGASEAIGPEKEMFGEDNVLTACTLGHRAGTGVSSALLTALSGFMGVGRSLSDDVTLVGARRT